jgi:hypothetical protein
MGCRRWWRHLGRGGHRGVALLAEGREAGGHRCGGAGRGGGRRRLRRVRPRALDDRRLLRLLRLLRLPHAQHLQEPDTRLVSVAPSWACCVLADQGSQTNALDLCCLLPGNTVARVCHISVMVSAALWDHSAKRLGVCCSPGSSARCRKRAGCGAPGTTAVTCWDCSGVRRVSGRPVGCASCRARSCCCCDRKPAEEVAGPAKPPAPACACAAAVPPCSRLRAVGCGGAHSCGRTGRPGHCPVVLCL